MITQTEMTEELNERQLAALEALLAGNNITESAAIASISRRTLSTWVNHNYAFRSALREGRQMALESALTLIQDRSRDVAKRLIDIALDTDSGKRDAVAAASKVLDLAMRAVDTDAVDARIDQLEQMVQGDDYAGFSS